MLIIKTDGYRPGINRIRGKLSDLDKGRSVKFDEGYTIEVSEEELERINKGWFTVVTKIEDDDG